MKNIILLNNSDNIGDDIQALSAMRFLEDPYKYILKSNMNLNEIKTEHKVILNGWWDKDFKDLLEGGSNIQRLITSFHLQPNSYKILNNFKNLKKFKSFGPIGARDLATYAFLMDKEVDTYFSGCLTLTLLPNKEIIRNGRILIVDLNNEVYEFLERKYPGMVDRISPVISPHLDSESRLQYAKNYLNILSKYRLIISNRLHACLPSLALETPVILIKDNAESDKRFSGLYNLLNTYSESELLNEEFDPLSLVNPSLYQDYRNKLVELATGFTGYDSNKTIIPTQINEFQLMTMLNMDNIRYRILYRFFMEKLRIRYFLKIYRYFILQLKRSK